MRHHQHQQLWVFLVAVLHAPSCVLVVLPFNNVGAPLVCVGAAAAVSVPERKDDFMAFVFTEGKDDQATLTRSHVGDDDGEEEDLFQPIWTLSSNDTTSTSVSKSTSTSTSVLPLDNRNHSNSNTTNHHHHHSKKQELEIDSSVVMAFVLCCVLAILYRKRRKLPGYWLQVKYYLCCCQLSEAEILGQDPNSLQPGGPEYETLNDFIFQVEDPAQTGRLRDVSGLTEDPEEDDDSDDDDDDREEAEAEDGRGATRPSRRTVSIQSVFPDLLGDAAHNHSNNPRDLEDNERTLTELLIPRQTNKKNSHRNNSTSPRR